MTDLPKMFGLEGLTENPSAAARSALVTALRQFLTSPFEDLHIVVNRAIIEHLIRDITFAVAAHPLGVPDDAINLDPIDLSGIRIVQTRSPNPGD